MKVMRYNPFNSPLNTANLEHLFDNFFTGVNEGNAAVSFTPQVDVYENEQSFSVEVALPGLTKEDINLEIRDQNMVISGEKKENEERKEGKFHIKENKIGSFKRSFVLPKNIDVEAIEAKHRDGILNVVIPKKEKSPIRNSVEIK